MIESAINYKQSIHKTLVNKLEINFCHCHKKKKRNITN